MITTSLASGYIFEVAKGLKERGYDVKILSLAGDHRWFKDLKVEVKYKESMINKISYTLYRLYKIYNLIKHRNSNINPYDSLLLLSPLHGIKPDIIIELSEFIQNFDSDTTIATNYLTTFSV